MKKEDSRIIKKIIVKPNIPQKENIPEEICYFSDGINYEDSFVNRPIPGPKPTPPTPPPGPTPPPVPPVPPKPGEIIYGDGLQVINNVVSVKSHHNNEHYMNVTKDGVSIYPLIRQMELMLKKLNCIEKRLTDAESDINILKRKFNPDTIIETVVDKSTSFIINEENKIEIKTDDGIMTDEDGNIVVNCNDSLEIEEDTGKIGVDYDDETISMTGDEDDEKLSAIWDSYKTI